MSILDKISSLTKRRGFIYPGSEIYGGMRGTWDYGPLGVELKRNIKQEFWKTMVQDRNDVVGMDTAILMNPKVWEASGHVKSFSDPLVECKKCHARFRADQLNWDIKKTTSGFSAKRLAPLGEKCPGCGKGADFTKPKMFNLLVEAYLGAVEGEKQKTYLRGEITQGVHVNFKNLLGSTRIQIPFGVAQVGRAFRNEISPGNLTFRSREFEQMELQFYIKPNEKESKKWFEYWKKERKDWYEKLGMNKKNLRLRKHEPDEMAHYAKDAWDIEYKLGDEWLELEGIHHRGDWDLRRHQEYSGEDMTYFDSETKERFLPWIIETSGGVDRAVLFFLVDAYNEEKLKSEESRVVLKLHPRLAPYKIAVFPLLANKPDLVKLAKSIYDNLKSKFMTDWDARGNIGKRYRYQDEMGTPYCVTVDFDSLEKKDVTVRDRDTMKQERVKIKDLNNWLGNKLG